MPIYKPSFRITAVRLGATAISRMMGSNTHAWIRKKVGSQANKAKSKPQAWGCGQIETIALNRGY
jgi:hypothetical protein